MLFSEIKLLLGEMILLWQGGSRKGGGWSHTKILPREIWINDRDRLINNPCFNDRGELSISLSEIPSMP